MLMRKRPGQLFVWRTNMPDITSLAQFGVAGLSVYLMWKLASNHLDHNTIVLGELRDAIKELKEWMINHK